MLTRNDKPYPLYRFCAYLAPFIIWFVQASIVAMASPPTNLSSSTTITTQTTTPTPSLPWGDINVLVLTDVHSWVGGHDKYGKGKEPYLNVDYGKVLSFYQYLKQYCDETNKDFWFVMNGDWIDGTGLSMNGDATHLTPLLEKMPWDAVNVGNHELYHPSVVAYAQQPASFVSWWGERYLSATVVVQNENDMKPFGNHYRVLHGKHASVLVFGFLYDMKGYADTVTVQEVETVVEQAWFADALRKEAYDAIMVLAHMHYLDRLVSVILKKIREITGPESTTHLPVQFITGHSHIRNFAIMDNASVSFEAGRYLDTVGFASFPMQKTLQNAFASALQSDSKTDAVYSGEGNLTGQLFQYVYLDANVDVLQQTLGITDSFDTPEGVALSTFIQRTRTEMGLDETVGCLPFSYYHDQGVDAPQSLWRFFQERVVPSQFSPNDVVFLSSETFRYSLLGSGNVSLDDIIAASPFNETLYAWEKVPSETLVKLNETMNSHSYPDDLVPSYLFSSPQPFQPSGSAYNLIVSVFDLDRIQSTLSEIDDAVAKRSPIITNQTTTDIWINHIRDHEPCGAPFEQSTDSSTTVTSKRFGFNNQHTLKQVIWVAALVVAAVVVILVSAATARWSRIGSRRRVAHIPVQQDDDIDEGVCEETESGEELI